MSHRILERDGAWIITFDDEDSCCAALDLRLPMGGDLRSGTWLILMVPIWSAPDRNAIDQAVRIVTIFAPQVRLGVGVFESHDEIQSWNPQLQARWQTPIWAVMKDGVVQLEQTGMLTDTALTQLLRRAT